MLNEYNYINFIPSVEPTKESSKDDLWFVFNNNKLLFVTENNEIKIPVKDNIKYLDIEQHSILYLGTFCDVPCYTSFIKENADLPENMIFQDLRSAGTFIDEELFLVCGRASQILAWHKTHKYCGRCGSETEKSTTERAMVCPKCGLISFPRISPAIIVAITKGEEILLAHNNNFVNGTYSLIAGFVEPGETFEQCVKREVCEEVGIRVKNIKYFSSQPWPFPNSIMVGFTAEYASGEIKPDGVEIGDANWFSIDCLPNLPAPISIARKIINALLKLS
jgi:NAD+ diphosphatase